MKFRIKTKHTKEETKYYPQWKKFLFWHYYFEVPKFIYYYKSLETCEKVLEEKKEEYKKLHEKSPK